MDIMVGGVEKYPTNMELACKLIKETMDKKYGAPWHVRCSHRVATRHLQLPPLLHAPRHRSSVTFRGTGRRRRRLWLHYPVRGEKLVLRVLRWDGTARRDSAVQVLCCMITRSRATDEKQTAGWGVGLRTPSLTQEDRVSRGSRGSSSQCWSAQVNYAVGAGAAVGRRNHGRCVSK